MYRAEAYVEFLGISVIDGGKKKSTLINFLISYVSLRKDEKMPGPNIFGNVPLKFLK